jgi:predicted thioesterase
MISVGTAGEGRMKVTEENTALAWGSGTLPVLATPAMILLIEETASECLQPFLQEGESTVGTVLDIKHSAASVIGSDVFCKVEITDIDRSRIIMSVRVWDSGGEVGSGIHERFVVNNEKFMAKATLRIER